MHVAVRSLENYNDVFSAIYQEIYLDWGAPTGEWWPQTTRAALSAASLKVGRHGPDPIDLRCLEAKLLNSSGRISRVQAGRSSHGRRARSSQFSLQDIHTGWYL